MRSAPEVGRAGVGSSGSSGEDLAHPHPVVLAARGSHDGHVDPCALQHEQVCRLQVSTSGLLHGRSARTRVTVRSGWRAMHRMITSRTTLVCLPSDRGASRTNRAHSKCDTYVWRRRDEPSRAVPPDQAHARPRFREPQTQTRIPRARAHAARASRALSASPAEFA
jgi:hypothetical protein